MHLMEERLRRFLPGALRRAAPPRRSPGTGRARRASPGRCAWRDLFAQPGGRRRPRSYWTDRRLIPPHLEERLFGEGLAERRRRFDPVRRPRAAPRPRAQGAARPRPLSRPQDLARRRRPGQGRPDEHGARPGGALSAARPPGGRARGAHCPPRLKLAGGTHQGPAAPGGGAAAAGRDPGAAEARLRAARSRAGCARTCGTSRATCCSRADAFGARPLRAPGGRAACSTTTRRGRLDAGWALWTLLMLEVWGREVARAGPSAGPSARRCPVRSASETSGL